MIGEKIVSLRELFFKAECLKINAKKALPVILKMAPKASVYLFGSLARGEIHEESDADLFVNSGVNFTSIEQREQFKINLADLVDNVCQDVHVVVDDPFFPNYAKRFMQNVEKDMILMVNQGKILKQWQE
ncbi:MAG: nucleotidyltransferase domain-containing protein [Patescibacteria group bacterium]